MIHVLESAPITTGKRIKELIKDSGMTQAQFAEKFKVDTKTVSAWVNNKYRITKIHLAEIAAFFHVDVEYLTCSQVEKNRAQTTWLDNPADPNSNDLQMLDAWCYYLKAVGYSFDFIHIGGNCEMEQFSEIIDGKLITFETPVQSTTEYSILLTSPDKTTKELSEKEWMSLQKEVTDFLSFKLKQL